MKYFAAYVGKYGELAPDSGDNMANLQTTNINKITKQTHRNMHQSSGPEIPKYILPKLFTSVKSMLEHWGQYVAANEERYNFSWRKDWSNSDKRRLSCVKSIVECI